MEIFHDDEWGTVCDDYWDSIDARVVCNQLGFFGDAYAVSAFQFGAGDSSMSIWLDNVHCTGTETYLSECPHNGWGVHNCGHFEDAGVVCQGQWLTATHSTIMYTLIYKLILAALMECSILVEQNTHSEFKTL